LKPIKKAVKIIADGNQSKFAKIISEKAGRTLSQQLVSRWINKRGCKCSPVFVPYIAALTDGKVTKEMLRPDIFMEIEKEAA